MASDPVAVDRIYEAVRAGIRDTDEASFKLRGLVPLVSGVGLVTVIFGETTPNPAMIVVRSLFSAIATLGLFFWELRNIQTCVWPVDYAKELEK